MSYARGAFETSIGAVGQVDNFGFVSPFSCRPSANSQYGRLTAGMLTESFPPIPDYNKSVSGHFTCKDRMTCGFANDFDGQYDEHLEDMETSMEAGDKAAISGQAQENDDGTVSVETSENPAETIKEQESFLYGGNLRTFQGGKFKVNKGGVVNVAKSKRVNPHTEHFGTELNGFKDSQYLHESFLNSKEEQEQSNATSLVILTVCFFFITIAVIWVTFGCNGCKQPVDNVAPMLAAPVETQPSLSGGKLTGSIF